MSYISKFLPLLLLILSTFTNAETINKINVEGLDTVSRGTVLNYIAIEVNDDVDIENLKIAYKNLLESELFSKVDLSLKEGILSVSLIENPTIKYFEINGYEEDEVLSEKIVLDIQNNFDFNIGRIFVQRNLDNLKKQIKNLYELNGFHSHKIVTEQDLDSKNRIGLTINIEENARSLIGKFNITGNDFFDSDELIELFDMGEPDFFLLNYFTQNDNFDKRKFEAGIQSLISKYTSKGFLDVKILESSVKLDRETNKLKIDISISEGPQYRLGNVKFTGEKLNFSESYLRSFIEIKKNDFFERAILVKNLENINRLFQDKGYAYSRVDSSVEKKENTLDLLISLDPNYQIYISRINISGNFKTQDDVIRRKLKLSEASIYSKTEIEESINSIKRLGFFSNVKYDIKRLANSPDKADIFIEVTETKTGELTLGLSHSNATGASVTAGISQNNILGTGNTLNAKISNSSAVKELSMYFKDPYFNKQSHSISYGFFNRSLDASNIDTSSYKIDESGVLMGYGIPISPYSDFFAEAKIASIDLNCGLDLKNTYEISDCSETKDLDIPISLTYTFNSLNDNFFPTDGNFNSLKSIISIPVSDYKYLKFEVNHKSYYPVLNDKTFKFSTRANLASGYGNDDLPFFKRYFEGGSSSIRGFDFNSLGSKYSNDKPKGGEFSFVSTLGVASPTDIIGIDNANMRLIGFLDAGTITDKFSDFGLDDIRSSVGVQFSWLTPVGPIGLHIARPIIKKNSDSTQSFSFELGTSF